MDVIPQARSEIVLAGQLWSRIGSEMQQLLTAFLNKAFLA